jgi:aldose 1-epimerase
MGHGQSPSTLRSPVSATILKLEDAQQQVQLLPAVGGGIARWNWNSGGDWFPVLRPWDGQSDDPCRLGGFPLLPWCNRITQGGFAHQGVHYALQENRAGEPYPIDGDGWQQPWQVGSHSERSAVLTLQSRRHLGNPHEYDAEQAFELKQDSLHIRLKVTHRGRTSLPYGLGMHLCFAAQAGSRLQAASNGVWLSGPDLVPIAHSSSFPPGWDFSQPAQFAADSAIDNCFTGWDGEMRLSLGALQRMLVLRMKNNSGFYILQRKAQASDFCFSPVTHPIDAFHAKARPGLVALAQGESAVLELELKVEKLQATD